MSTDINAAKVTDFEPLRNEKLKLQAGEQDLELELIEAVNIGKAHGDRRQPFSVLFRCEGQQEPLPQGTYPIEHAKLGRVELFLVPLGPDKEGMQYEAVFA